jgi:hypothetical protein
MRAIPTAALCLLVAACGESAPHAQPADQPAAAPAAGAPAPASPIPGQGIVTKTLGGTTVAAPDQGQGPSPGDQAITTAIRRAMMADAALSARAQEVRVSTVNGRVTLRGSVASAAERSSLERLARDASGIGAAVDSLLEVAPRP